jgi:hypothetical protein
MQLSYSPGTTLPNDHTLHLQPLDGALRELGERAQLLADQAQLLMRAATRNNDRMAETHAPRVAGALKAVADAVLRQPLGEGVRDEPRPVIREQSRALGGRLEGGG